MTVVDPISDMLTRIRNAILASFDKVEVPCSKIKIEIARILKAEGYIRNYEVTEDDKKAIIVIYLKYNKDKSPVIKGLKRISKPSCKVYAKTKKIPRVLNGLGINVISTSRGVVTDREARGMGVGGEVICSVW